MLGPAMSFLTVLTATLILLAWQGVSDSMPGSDVSLQLTVLTATLVLLAWQQVSDFMPGSAVPLLTVLIVWSDSMWVIPCQVQLCLFSLFSLPLLMVLLVWQLVSDFMSGPAMSLLTILTATLVLLIWQGVNDFMLSFFLNVNLSPSLHRMWVLSQYF